MLKILTITVADLIGGTRCAPQISRLRLSSPRAAEHMHIGQHLYASMICSTSNEPVPGLLGNLECATPCFLWTTDDLFYMFLWLVSIALQSWNADDQEDVWCGLLDEIYALLPDDAAKSVACAMVAGRLDYCNAVLYGTSSANIDKLQRLQNMLARVVTNTRRRDHITVTPVLADLQWLPVRHRIEYKIALITFKALTTQQPQYLSELIGYYKAPRKLWSRGVNILQTNATALDFSKRAFCHASPTVWNNLPQFVISDLTVTTGTFKHRLKSATYTRAITRDSHTCDCLHSDDVTCF